MAALTTWGKGLAPSMCVPMRAGVSVPAWACAACAVPSSAFSQLVHWLVRIGKHTAPWAPGLVPRVRVCEGRGQELERLEQVQSFPPVELFTGLGARSPCSLGASAEGFFKG